jgi:hypothetical protein
VHPDDPRYTTTVEGEKEDQAVNNPSERKISIEQANVAEVLAPLELEIQARQTHRVKQSTMSGLSLLLTIISILLAFRCSISAFDVTE